jgi:xanthine dehydrogenase molybdenum-binding subunit
MLKEKVLRCAAVYSGKEIKDLDLVDGNIVLVTGNSTAAGTDSTAGTAAGAGEKLFDLAELATETLYDADHAEHLTAEATAQVKSNAFSFGCAFVEIEVDIPLGKIKLIDMINCHDCGTLINPQTAAAQVHGGMSMGIGFGMYEKMLYDPKTGKLLNGNLLDYKLPTIMEHPHLETWFVENPEPTSPYGTKALGEPPTVPGAAAIRNAVLNATGVAINVIPLTPHVLFEEFKKAGLI